MINWLSQVASVALFNLRTIPGRFGSALSAAAGIAGVVAVLTGVLAIAEGFKSVMTAAGIPNVAVVLRKGADSEMTSAVSREEANAIKDSPGIAIGPKGPVASAELFVIVNLPKRSTGTDANVPLRGVEEPAFDVRGNIQVVKGRRFESGKNELLVGAGAARAFAGLDVGQQIKIGLNTWTVTGIFTADGGVAESELWTDADVLMPGYQRTGYQSVYARLKTDGDYGVFKDSMTTNVQLKEATVQRSAEFYAGQSEMLTEFIWSIGVTIAALMALGALFGALNTMYGAVSARTREIATLRALGFGAGPVVLSILAESLVLSLLGGAVGAAGAYIAFDGFQASTLNWQTFSQVTFAFAVTPELLKQAVVWAAVLGVLGGLFPAIRAARLPIAAALRET